MENNYRHTNTTVSLINYHFVFCPRYRRKIFLIPKVEQRFKELVKLKCKELEIEIIAIECDKDHSHNQKVCRESKEKILKRECFNYR